MGGEQMADSVILGENAYRVQSGFVGIPEVEVVARRVAPPPLPTANRKPTRESDDPLQNQTLVALQKFFLTNVK